MWIAHAFNLFRSILPLRHWARLNLLVIIVYIVYTLFLYNVCKYVYICIHTRYGSLFFFPSSFLVVRSSRFVNYFYSWPRIFGFPPATPLADSRPYTTPPRPRPRYSAHQVIYSLSSRPSRNWKIHPSTRDKTGHIHGSVWFPNLCAATKTSSEIYYCGRNPPQPPTPHRRGTSPARTCPPLRSSSSLRRVSSDRPPPPPHQQTTLLRRPLQPPRFKIVRFFWCIYPACRYSNIKMKTPEHNKSSVVGRPRTSGEVKK